MSRRWRFVGKCSPQGSIGGRESEGGGGTTRANRLPRCPGHLGASGGTGVLQRGAVVLRRTARSLKSAAPHRGWGQKGPKVSFQGRFGGSQPSKCAKSDVFLRFFTRSARWSLDPIFAHFGEARAPKSAHCGATRVPRGPLGASKWGPGASKMRPWGGSVPLIPPRSRTLGAHGGPGTIFDRFWTNFENYIF